MSYKYFTINERNKLEVLLKENYRISKIAKILNRHRATIYREIKRINGEYSSENAQSDANTKSANKGRNSKITAELKNLIEDRLCKTWSPEQIAGRELKGRLSFKTIYNWLYSNFLDVSLNVLRRKGRRAKTKETRGKFNIGKSIGDRPEEVKKKEVFGHWELDSVVSSRGESKACFATFVELKTRFYVAIKMKDRSKNSMLKAIKQLTASIPKGAFKTFTSDRGERVFMLGRSGEDGNRILFCRSLLLMAERMQWKQQRSSKRILPKEDRYIKSRHRRLDKNLNVDKLKTKKMFKLCYAIWKIFTRN